MERRVTDIDLKHLTVLEFSASKTDGLFRMNSRWLSNFNEDIHRKQWLTFADDMWNQAVKLFSALCGFKSVYIHPGRWRISDNGDSMSRRFNSPAWGETPYKSINAIIHLRDSFIDDRSIDEDFIDLFLMCDADPYGLEHDMLDNDERVLSLLSQIEPQLIDVLSEITQIVTKDKLAQVVISTPIWEEECVVEYGGDGYWIRGIIR
jgi:hypothetical protein